jgi:exonuclease III
LSRHDYTSDEWSHHEQHNSRRGWAPPTDAAAPGGSIWKLQQAGFIDAYRALHSDPTRRPTSPPWTAHVRAAAGPKYRIDYMWSRPPEAGLFLEPRSGFVGHECGEASDHQPVVIDFEPRLRPPAAVSRETHVGAQAAP